MMRYGEYNCAFYSFSQSWCVNYVKSGGGPNDDKRHGFYRSLAYGLNPCSGAAADCHSPGTGPNGDRALQLLPYHNCPDGDNPDSRLTSDGKGNFYGTTYAGGLGFGTVFELSPSGSGGWNETVLYSFCLDDFPVSCADGGTQVTLMCYSTHWETFTEQRNLAARMDMASCSN